MRNEDSINTVLKSSDGIVKVMPADELFAKIELKIKSKNVVPLKTIWLVAACIVVLISLNIILLSSTNKSNQYNMASFENSINKSNQFYK